MKKLTGKQRYRVATNWYGKQTMVLQVEENHTYHYPTSDPSDIVGHTYDNTEYRDARPEDLLTKDVK
jgi:hypothetical protein